MEYQVKIGNRTEEFNIPQEQVIGVLHANNVQVDVTGAAVVAHALAHPVGTPRLKDLVTPGQTVCIMTSDVTRPLPTATVLPPVMDELHAAGVADADVLVAIGLGSHRPQTDEELARILGEYAGRLRVLNGDSQGIAHIGTTSAGTPVEILQEVMACDVRIALGNVEYHYFAGYSGGAKAMVPGVATTATIAANHALMVSDQARSGNMESPVRLDLEEAVGMAGLDFIVNAVLDERKQIIYCAAGHYAEAHRDACRTLDELYGCKLGEYADIVIVSQGGAPKDLNLYQTQKALDNAKHPVKDGGIIILVGSCAEGLGNSVFERWMLEADAPQEVVDRLAAGFRLGGHKAASIAQIALRASIYLVSDMDPDLVRRCFMTPFATVQDAVDAAIAQTGPTPRVLIMPHGGSTLPLMR